MMGRIIDLSDRKFGKLTVLDKSTGRTKNRKILWVCQCECGKTTEVTTTRLLSGETTSCGCARTDKGKAVQEYNKSKLINEGVFTPLLKSKVRSDSKTGVKGVTKKKNGKYQARITVKNKQIHLGYFDTLNEASRARKEAEDIYHKPYLEDDNERN